MRNMATIAIINLKGGVGKSVTACNLACILSGIYDRRRAASDRLRGAGQRGRYPLRRAALRHSQAQE